MNKSVQSDSGPSQHRKSKKKTSRNSSSVEAWHNNESQEANEDEAPAMEYPPMYWQQPRIPQPQPHPPPNGQRLFAAMSDPSVCGYSAVPVTYAIEPVSLPPVYQLFQPVVRSNYRPYRGRPRPPLRRVQQGPPGSGDLNGYSSLQENGWNHSIPMGYQNGDYASLPPTANIDNKDNVEELNSEHRRYSDPGLKPAAIPSNSKSDDSDSGDSGSSITTVEKKGKLMSTFIEQMTKMKEENSQLFKELHEAKTELQFVKTELNQLKKIFVNYQPGMLSDMIKEIRDASKIKEEAMLSKVEQLISQQQTSKLADFEAMKSQLDKVLKENSQSEQRIAALESEVAAFKLNIDAGNQEMVAYERENLALRCELEEARASRNNAENHATKMERLMEMLQEKAQAAAGRLEKAASSSDSDSDEEPAQLQQQQQQQPAVYSDTSSINNSANNSSNSLATGPVTDL